MSLILLHQLAHCSITRLSYGIDKRVGVDVEEKTNKEGERQLLGEIKKKN
jgi:4'-phosphopantetheinyl transferase EntD